jgi:hypothetical protein
LYVQSTPSGFSNTTVVLGAMVVQSLNMSFTYNYTTIPTTQAQYFTSGVNIVAYLADAVLNNTQMTPTLGPNGPNPFWQQQSLVINQGLPGSQELLMPYIGVDFVSTNPSGVYLLDLASSNWLAFSQSCMFTMPQT